MRIHPKTIICAIDFSAFTESVMAFGVLMAKSYSAKLFLVHITVDVDTLLEHHETTLDVKALRETNIREARRLLEDLTKGIAVENEVIIRQGAPADTISSLAVEKNADMVISASHGRSGFKRLVLGSVTEKLIKTLHCPLLVLPAHEDGTRYPSGSQMTLGNILVGCDFSPDSKLALEYALSLAQEFQAALYLAHVIKPSRYRDKREAIGDLHGRLEKQLESLVPASSREWCRAETVLLEGEPSEKLVNFAEQRGIDMMVLGIRGHTLLEKLLVGSTTDRVIRQARVPVLAVRQE